MSDRRSFRLRLALCATALLTGCAGGPEGIASPPAQSASAPTAVERVALPPVSAATEQRVTRWLALTAPGPYAPAQDYADFLTSGTKWPLRGLMMARYEHQLAEADTVTLSRLCPLLPPNRATAFLRCAPALPDAAARARVIWTHDAISSSEEPAFLARFGDHLTPDDQWARFQTLESSGQIAAARRQIARLAPARQNLARARLAFRLATPDADSTLAALSPDDLADPILTLARLHALRRADRLGDALALWKQSGFTVERRAPSHRWWSERAALSRALLSAGSPPDALLLARDVTAPVGSPQRLEAQFLTGWIELRALHDPSAAIPLFTDLLQDRSIITRAKGAYWLGRAHRDLGHEATARQAWTRAAQYPTTFYGQLALAALNGNVPTLLPDAPPVPGLDAALARLPPAPQGRIGRPDLAEAATWLVRQGDSAHARLFLMLLQSETTDPADQAQLARLGWTLGLYEPAVFAARSTGRQGVTLYPLGWPLPPDIDTEEGATPPGLALGVARQESSFDPDAESPARAIGLMQFQTGTARDVVRRAGLSGLDISPAGLRDPRTSMILGRAYLAYLLSRFDNVVPEALAAYNAGPHRTAQWLESDPLPVPLTQDALIDWIEKLPYEETRAYIQHVEENRAIYRLMEAGHA
ncbi:lytic transglycosylase domain-containing protein [Acidomonas methanolica]|uniref:Soluble lytic murein transglycosylase n=4 Tax=Acidomonas methanolica TaxID=437 RepID=A0A023D0X6_ACIMT|nr:lytic transglycosylase domain-containing protein [Acidomonas methanolica]MBU2653378.1 lytic transglycosylase domain-containing protein [Acidomonas methanolica]TCS32329.1 soluble lytic murein transglycosylase [Acidomonas methanolica]GAJ27704.1 soluble lytic murein transglycosylase [Acidomonas methanolica NBRC 104435]GEK97766.1 lytic transglycosylase [Acidomonas methanolica NBRC 104435]